jgi:hypothetical protein
VDPVFEAEQLPGGIAHLHARLPDVDGNNFTLKIEGNLFSKLLITHYNF